MKSSAYELGGTIQCITLSFLHTQEWNFIIQIFKEHSFDKYFPGCQEIWVVKKKKKEREVGPGLHSAIDHWCKYKHGFHLGSEAGIFDPQVVVYLKLCIIFLAVHLKYTSYMAAP